MPNNYNYRSSVPSTTTFSVSRIAREPTDVILVQTLPAGFAFDAQSNIELHFYNQPTNTLLLSLVVEPADLREILKSHVVSYDDGSLRNYIRIDFTRLFELKQTLLVPGDYKVVMNFFANEIGDYFNRNLTIEQISDSRTEVELAFAGVQDQVDVVNANNLLREFVDPSFEKPIAVGVAEKVFFSGVDLGDSSEGITYDGLPDTITTSPESLEDVSNRLGRVSSQLQTEFEQQVNAAIQNIYTRVKEDIIQFGDFRIQREELDIFIRSAVEKEITALQNLVDSRIVVR
jgi:hypothetical protein